MKKFSGRLSALLLCLLLAVSAPVCTLAEANTEAAESTQEDESAQTDTEEAQPEEDGEDESTTYVTTVTVDEDGNVIDESQEQSVGILSTEDLETWISKAESLAEDEALYKEESWTKLLEALESAQEALSSADQDEIDAASESLSDAIENLEYLNAEDLEDTIEEAEKLVESDYSSATWADLQTALENAKSVLTLWKKEQAEDFEDEKTLTEKDIAQAAAALNEAVENLAEPEVTTKTSQTSTSSKSYSMSISVKTSTVSSSNSNLKTIKVTKPKLVTTTTTTTTTTTKTYTDGVLTDTSTSTGTSTSTSTSNYSLTVKVFVRNNGWCKASLNSDSTYYTYTASKASSGSYISAIQITPSSNLKSKLSSIGYTFVYRATVKTWGTLGWAKMGEKAGTSGNSLTLKSVTVKFLTTSAAKKLDYDDNYINQWEVTYKTKLSGASSYSSAKTNGSTSGSTSSGKSIGSVAMKLTGTSRFSGSIKYSIRTSTSDSSSNWSSYKSNYSTAGSTNSKIKAIKVQLTGDMADHYDVYYRVYVSGYGWLGWAKNGAKAGTSGVSCNISAIQVKLVVKGGSAPGSTSNTFISTSSSAKLKMIVKAQSFSSSTKYLILVDRANCKVGIFTGKKNNWTLKYYWSCCVGKSSTPTISGSYTVGIKGYSFGESKGYSCYYYTQIHGNYLFHSVLYYPYSSKIKDGTMGKAVSHGCVRLTKDHAYWIYKNVGKGSKIYIY